MTIVPGQGTNMKLMTSLAILGVLLSAATQGSNVQMPEAAAEAAARVWLGLVDAGDYAESWVTGAEYFRNSVAQSDWVSSVARVRGSLGGLKSRRLVAAKYARSLPGAPDGEYVVIQFATSFEKKAEAIETVTPMKDRDGRWRVSGYYIR